MPVETQAALEIARFIAFQPSPEVVERAYELINAEHTGTLTDDEHEEIESYLAIQHIMILAKAEAHGQLQQQDS